MNDDIWIVGAGGMALDYYKVLKGLDQKIIVIGRGIDSCLLLEDKIGIEVEKGGLELFLKTNPKIPKTAIVAVGIEELANTTESLIDYGVKKIMIEKPGSLFRAELESLARLSKENHSEVVVGYNRRMYASVLEAQRIIEMDGGATSMHFEFTEWSHIIESLNKAAGVKESWVLANSTHVIDLAFHLTGKPHQINSITAGGVDWHKKSSIFAGSGITENEVLFTYGANWSSPGRWGIEVLTKKHRLILRPLEKLRLMKIGSIKEEEVTIDDSLDKEYKPGLYRQVEAFLNGSSDEKQLCKIDHQLLMWPMYEKIAGYNNEIKHG